MAQAPNLVKIAKEVGGGKPPRSSHPVLLRSIQPLSQELAMNSSRPLSAEYAVQAVNVVKTYVTDNVEVKALRGVSLDVPKGDMVAIMGPSGCGKTTLLNCLSGIDDVTSGVVRVGGVDISKLSDNEKSAYRARNMGFVFQFYNLLPVLNAIENVEMPLLVSGVPARGARDRALQALRLVHLEEWAHHKPAQLSGGQRQRVTIARALVNEPAIVWADEPTGDLDSQNAGEIMDLMVALNAEKQQTFVIVTHDRTVAERTFRIVNMLDGLIVSETRTERGQRGEAVGTRAP
jgi:putative ABC transport system ATP-binding protein